MVRIDEVSWGKVEVDGKQYHQVLIVNDKVEERENDKLHRFFKTTHQIGDWEEKKILSENPEIVLIASGWSGFLKVKGDFKEKIKKAGAELQIVLTPQVVKRYNQLIQKGKKVNVLIHTTC